MTTINREPYTITLKPGANVAAASKKCAEYIINTWLPNNAGGVHFMLTPKLTLTIYEIYKNIKEDTKLRVTIKNNVPHIEVVPSSNVKWADR
jgi:hypothetical protein